MIGAIKMLDSINMLITEFLHHTIFIFIIEIKITECKFLILLDNFIQNINIKWKSFSTIKLFNELSANRASYSILMMKFTNTACAQSVTAMYKNSWYSFSYIIFKATELAYVKASGLVIQLHYFVIFLGLYHLFFRRKINYLLMPY